MLRIQGEGGRHAFVGLGFSERNHSFDFNVALGEHEKHARLAEREKEEAARAEASYAAAPKVDRSLKQGETITIALKKPGAAADGSKAKPSWMSNAKASGGLGGFKGKLSSLFGSATSEVCPLSRARAHGVSYVR